MSHTPDSLCSAEEEGIRTDSALGDLEDSQKPSNRSDSNGGISVEVTDVLDGQGMRFRGSNKGKRNRSASPPSTTLIENGISRLEWNEADELPVEGESDPIEVLSSPVWKFPPALDDFDLMESDVDPSQLEDIFVDDRYTFTSLYIIIVALQSSHWL